MYSLPEVERALTGSKFGGPLATLIMVAEFSGAIKRGPTVEAG